MVLLSTPQKRARMGRAQLGNTQGPNSVVHLVSNGQVLVSYRAAKNFREFLFSSDRIVNGQTYQVYVGGSISGTTSVACPRVAASPVRHKWRP